MALIYIGGKGIFPLFIFFKIMYNLIMKNEELINKFLDYLKNEKNYSDKTIKSYEEDLNSFCVKINKDLLGISEEDIINGGNEYYKKVCDYAKSENSEVVMICAKIESELAELNDDDKAEFLAELGIEEAGLDQLIKKTYSLLGLATFFTAGSDEVRAWTFKKGMKAPQCAGIIHTDFERGFIRAEVISYDDLVKFGSEKEVKENGKMRLEGKDYLMQDGDICYFRFNV